MQNIAHLCTRSKSKTWGVNGWKKVDSFFFFFKFALELFCIHGHDRWWCASLQTVEKRSTPELDLSSPRSVYTKKV